MQEFVNLRHWVDIKLLIVVDAKPMGLDNTLCDSSIADIVSILANFLSIFVSYAGVSYRAVNATSHKGTLQNSAL